MPLVRLEVRNEYGLGQPELYKKADREDPKAVLDGVAVAGLVGILRQLGDLAEFAAEVFHGLQEQVMTTASRSHKLKGRVKHLEAALTPLEKAVLAQTSHIHFAYTAGSEWHPRIRNERNHFIYNDLPRFIMDSYEECRDPPRLHLLDKFDTGGPGSCLKKYSDPTFFKKASVSSDEVTTGKVQIDKKARRSKKKRSSQGNGQLLRATSVSNHSSRFELASSTINGQTSPLQTGSAADMKYNSDLGDHSNSFDSSGLPFASHVDNREASPSQTASTVDAMLKSDPGDYSNSFGSRAGSGYIECVFHLSSSMEPEQKESCSSQSMQHNETLDSVFPEEQTKAVYYDIPNSSLQEQIASSSSCVTWDEKAEIVEPRSQQSDGNEALEMLWTKSDADSHGWRAVDFTNVDKTDSLPDQENNPQSILSLNQVDDVESTPEMLWTKSVADSHGRRTVDLTNVDKTDSLPEVENNLRSMSSLNQISDIESAPEMLWTGSDADSHAVRAVDKTDSPPDLENNLRSMSSQNQISYVESAPEMLRTISDADSHAARAVDETDSLHDLENNLRSMSSQNQIGYIGSAPEMLWRKSDLDSHAARAVDETDSLHDLENNLRSMSSQNQIDVVESSPEMLWTESDADGHGGRVFDFSNVDKIDCPPDLESNLKSMSSQNQIDDVESAPEVLWSKSDADSHLVRAVDFTNIDKTDSQPVLQNNHRSISSQSQIDDVESEPENYMDALNTIESESENELDCQTKTEVEHTSGINDKGIDETHEHSVKLVDHNSLELESDTASCSSSDEGITSNISNSVSPDSFGHEQSVVNDFDHSAGGLPQISKFSDLDQTVVEDFGGKADVLNDSNLGSVISGQIDLACEISDIQDPSRDKIISNICESEETPADFSGVHSVKFWTNGGLLGLEPSKPPDYMTPNGVGHNSMNRSKDEAVCHSAHRKLKGDEDEEQKSKLAKTAGEVEKDSGYECSTSCQNDEEEVSTKKTDWGSSQAGSDAKCEKNRVMAPRIDVPITPDIKAIPPEAKSRNDENDENDENSSIMFGLSRRLLANGFSKKVSFSRDDNSEIGSFANAVNQTIAETTFEEQFGHESLIDSLTSSPPLEHMKISFHPLNSFETPKLKLKFPDGNQCLEGIRDVFPSFQLVPEHDIPLNDLGSESDDDTFCRSSPCKSPDSNSHYSESNSEQWESGETPERKALELYDALCGISSEESMLSSLDLGGIATNGICIDGGTKSADSKKGMEPSSCGPFLDLPNFDTLNPIPQQDMKEDSYSLKSEHSQQPTPQPPPLPPAQWWGSKSHLDVTEDKQNDVSKALRHAVDLKLVGSPVLQQPKLAPANQHHTSREATTVERKSKQDHQKLKEQKDADQASNGKGMDDREDFLQQIRSKSFSLRSTMSTKPTNTPGPAANVKVTAILEKASAIRQAVASDDGDDDDTWSDA